jgi:hypothetical protein
MRNKAKQKKRLRKAIQLRKKERLNIAWRNIWIKAGILNG